MQMGRKAGSLVLLVLVLLLAGCDAGSEIAIENVGVPTVRQHGRKPTSRASCRTPMALLWLTQS